MRVPAGTGQEGRTDSPASGGGGAPHSGGVRTLPHADNQLGGQSQGGLCTHQLLGPELPSAPAAGSLLRLFFFL